MHQLKVWFYSIEKSTHIADLPQELWKEKSQVLPINLLPLNVLECSPDGGMLGLEWWKEVQYHMHCRCLVNDFCSHLHQTCQTLSCYRIGKLGDICLARVAGQRQSTESCIMGWLTFDLFQLEIGQVCPNTLIFFDILSIPKLFWFSVDWCNPYACTVYYWIISVLYWILFVWLLLYAYINIASMLYTSLDKT